MFVAAAAVFLVVSGCGSAPDSVTAPGWDIPEVTGISSKTSSAPVNESKLVTAVKKADWVGAPSRESVPEKGEGRYAYGFLNGEERLVYDMIAGAMLELEAETGPFYLESEEVFRISDCVLADYPEIFWVESGISTTVTVKGEFDHLIYGIEYCFTREERDAAAEEIERAVSGFVAANSGAGEYEKALAVYEFIIDGTEYGISEHDQTIYGVFAEKLAVCGGYARATQYLLTRLGLECAFVTGEIINGDAHAWNLVKVDGEYYYIDSTWGDPVFGEQEAAGNELSHMYFCITTGEIEKTHMAGGTPPLPQCTATAANYFVRNGRMLDSYSPNAVLAALYDSMASGRSLAELRCTGAEAYLSVSSALFEGGEIYKLFEALKNSGFDDLDSGRALYSLDDTNYLIKIYLG